MEPQKSPTVTATLRKEDKAEGIMLPDFRIFHETHQNSMILTHIFTEDLQINGTE